MELTGPATCRRFRRRTIWIVDAHRDGTRFLVRADEKLTAFLELEWPIRLDAKGGGQNRLS